MTYCTLACLVTLAGALVVSTVRGADDTKPVVGTAQIARDGRALRRVVVASDASATIERAADDLTTQLSRIADAKFEVVHDATAPGIRVGLPSHFRGSPMQGKWQPPKVGEREDYLLQSHADGVWILGATDEAVRHAVWDFLHRLGYRQFFPGERWEVVPRQRDLKIALDTLQSPNYSNRRIWYGFGAWDYAKKPYAEWNERNRMGGGIELSTGHAYDGIVKALAKEFEQHPEYWPLLGGERKPVRNPKPCLGNAELRAKIVRHAIERFEKNPSLDSVSMDPSDGGGWCECDSCAKLGTVSDQALILANEVAQAINAKFPDKVVGMYAYNYHSSPPNIVVDPHVTISVATAFIKGGQTLDELLAGWADKKATLGIREYYSVNTWDRDQPGHARGGNLSYLKKTIPEFHAKGARYLSAESSDNWGPNGLGYYLASRMMWDVKEAERIDDLIDDFLQRAFGPAKETMREFYDQLDGSKPHLVVHDQLGRMYRALQKGREQLSDRPEMRARVDDLVLYARYCSLYHDYATADGAARQAAFETLIRHAYRMRTTMLVHTYGLYRDLAGRDKSIKIPDDAKWNVPEGKNPWKSSEPFTAGHIERFLAEGVARHKLVELAFKPTTYSTDLAPAGERLKLPTTPAAVLGAGRGVQTFHTFVDRESATVTLEITGGMIAHYRDRGNVKVEAWKIGGASETGEKETLVATDRSTPPDGVKRTVALRLTQPGHYKITVSDGGDKTLVEWPAAQPMTIVSTQDEPMNRFYGQWQQYFYVPKGTTTIGLFGGEHGEVRDSKDRPHFWLNGREPNYYAVDVPPGEDGKVWQIRYGRGPIRLLTVPPCYSSSPQTLLLPREVVARDENR